MRPLARTVVVSSDRHRRHAPLAEIESSGLQAPWEHPGRADAIHDTLAADDRFRDGRARRLGHRRRSPRCTTRAWSSSSTRAWARLPGPTSRHARRGARRVLRRRPARRDRSAARRTAGVGRTRQVVLRDHDAADRGDLRRGSRCRRRRADRDATGPRRRRATRTACAARPAITRRPAMYGGYCFFNNAADRRAPRRVDDRQRGSRCSTSTTTTATARSRSSTTATTCSTCRCTATRRGPTRTSPGSPTRPGAGRGRGANLNVPLAAHTRRRRAISPRCAIACEAIDAFDPSMVIVSLGLDTYHADPISDLGVTADGFHRQGALVGRAWPARRWCCRRAATTWPPSATTPAQWLLGLAVGRVREGRASVPGTDARPSAGQLTKPLGFSQSRATASASSSSMPTRRLSSVSCLGGQRGADRVDERLQRRRRRRRRVPATPPARCCRR